MPIPEDFKKSYNFMHSSLESNAILTSSDKKKERWSFECGSTVVQLDKEISEDNTLISP